MCEVSSMGGLFRFLWFAFGREGRVALDMSWHMNTFGSRMILTQLMNGIRIMHVG